MSVACVAESASACVKCKWLILVPVSGPGDAPVTSMKPSGPHTSLSRYSLT